MADPTRVQGYCRHVTAHHCNVTSHHTGGSWGYITLTAMLPLEATEDDSLAQRTAKLVENT
jgi:hypothetical protein